MREARLGCGLIAIGRKWGHIESAIPSEVDSVNFLTKAYEYGIDFYDTSPSYGVSEQRLGIFLESLSAKERDRLTIATKFGEHWNTEMNEPYVDHSYDALKRSLDQSIKLLGKIDVLQLHKTTPQVLQSEDFNKAVEYARSLGINTIGASITDLESANIVSVDQTLNVLQFPYNLSNMNFHSVFEWAKNKLVIVNRPFAMGALLYEPGVANQNQQKIDAYKFILREKQNNLIILTGTKDPNHLQENIQAFKNALNN